jgi:dihydrofolate reductase
MSVDGKLTNGNSCRTRTWHSAEDFKFFSSIVASHDLIIMGRKTYNSMRPKPKPQRLCIVLTSAPETYSAQTINNQVEFSNEKPHELVKRLEKRGYSRLLLLGGGQLNAAFLEKGFVDELYITIEPFVFGSGIELVSKNLVTRLALMDFKRLNDNGTILLRYEVL